jgi:trehalose 6-phosphate phosphatase
MQQLGTDIGQLFKNYGVEVENNRYTLTFHYRGTNEPARVRMTLLLLLDQLTPTPRLIFGKASVSILPSGKDGKGPAALALMRHLRQTGLFFIGDDDTDEEVFEFSEGLVMGMRVRRHSKSRAQYYVKDQGAIEDVIRVLAHSTNRAPEFLNSHDGDTKNRKKAVHEP